MFLSVPVHVYIMADVLEIVFQRKVNVLSTFHVLNLVCLLFLYCCYVGCVGFDSVLLLCDFN